MLLLQLDRSLVESYCVLRLGKTFVCERKIKSCAGVGRLQSKRQLQRRESLPEIIIYIEEKAQQELRVGGARFQLRRTRERIPRVVKSVERHCQFSAESQGGNE